VSVPSVVDIAIVGGGLVGTPLAIMLARQGWSVALLEQQAPTIQASGSKGFTALSDSTVGILDAHQLWKPVAEQACAIREVHVSHKGYFGSTHIRGEQFAVKALGHVVDNALFLESLQTAVTHSTLHRLSAAAVRQVEYETDFARVHYSLEKTAHTLQCKLVVAVDGVSSSFLQPQARWPYCR